MPDASVKLAQLEEDKRVLEDALRGRDAVIAQLKAAMESAVDTTSKAFSRMGVPTNEERKEELEDKLVRLAHQLCSLAHDGSLVYSEPLDDLFLSKGQVQDKFLTQWAGSDIKDSVIGYKLESGARSISAPGLDTSRWYSCQMNYRSIVQIKQSSNECRLLTLSVTNEFRAEALAPYPDQPRSYPTVCKVGA